MRGILSALLAIGLAACSQPPAAPEPPAELRIVSINPCIDAILMQVAEPSQIAAISHYSKDPRASSIASGQAARFQATSGTAEEVVALAPDLVLAGAHVAPATVAALKRMRIGLLQFGVPESIAESRAQVVAIAAAVGQPERGKRLAAEIDAAVRNSRSAGPPVPALIWHGGGLVPGQATLADDMLRTAGYRNLSAEFGLKAWDLLSLERLVARPPDILFSVGEADRSDRMLSHPVVEKLKGHSRFHPFPERLLHCGGPTIIDALAALSAARPAA
jgi:iron complex transport system substrate-binding protein